MALTLSSRSASSGSGTADPHRAAAVWATVGLVWVIVSTQAILRWVASDSQFKPVTARGPDVYPGGGSVAARTRSRQHRGAAGLRVVLRGPAAAARREVVLRREARHRRCLRLGRRRVSQHVQLPLRLERALRQRGVWTSFLPFHHEGAPSLMPRGGVGHSDVHLLLHRCGRCRLQGVRTLRERYPTISNPAAFSVVFLSEFTAGCLLENLIIRTTQAYGYAQTNASLHAVRRQVVPVPIYESLFTATMAWHSPTCASRPWRA